MCAFTHDALWFRCASQCAFAKPPPEVVSMRIGLRSALRVDHVGNYLRGCVMLKHSTAGANSTQRIGLVERSLLLSRLCFRCSWAQLNNRRTANTVSVNVGHFVTRSSCITISTYDAHCPQNAHQVWTRVYFYPHFWKRNAFKTGTCAMTLELILWRI